MSYDRKDVQGGLFDDLIMEAASRGVVQMRSEAKFEASRRAVLDGIGPDGDLWIFGYGSLIWKPAFEFVEQRSAQLHGWHRQFCLWTPVGRGTPEQPGLALGLDRGGSCSGVAYRIDAAHREQELDLIWRREMLVVAYEPHWVQLRCAEGEVRAIAMTIDPSSPLYAKGLELEDIARVLATAKGELGSARDYLENTVAHLEELDLAEQPLLDILARVRAMTAP